MLFLRHLHNEIEIILKKGCLLIFLVLFASRLFAQLDTIHSHYLSANATSFLTTGEVGFYYEYWPASKFSFRVSYGHRFWQPNLIVNGGSGSGIQYYPGKAEVARLGTKMYFFKDAGQLRRFYLLYNLNGMYFDSGKYTTRSGSNGMNGIPRWVTRVERMMGGMSVGGGTMQKLKNRLFIDYFIAFGYVMGEKTTTDYSYGGYAEGNIHDYDPDRVEKGRAAMPLVEFGICVGGVW